MLATATVQAYQFDNMDDFEKVEAPAEKLEVHSSDFRAIAQARKSRSEEDMVQAVSKILSLDEKNLMALNAMAAFYFDIGKYGMAKILINRALEDHPRAPALHNNLGVILLAEGEQRKAISAFRKSIDIKADYRIGLANLGSIYIEYRDYSKALAPLEAGYSAVKEGVKKGEQDAIEVANNYALVLMGMGEYGDAKQIFEQVLEVDSRNTSILVNYAILLIDKLKKADAAVRIISKIKFIADNQEVIRQAEELEKRMNALEK